MVGAGFEQACELITQAQKNLKFWSFFGPSNEYEVAGELYEELTQLLEAFGPLPILKNNMEPLDHILNNLPRSDLGVSLGKWEQTWPSLLRVLREIDRLSHPGDDYDEDEHDPEEY